MPAQPTVSFEFFPPRTHDDAPALWEHVDKLVTCKPAFITMTMTGEKEEGPAYSTKYAVELAQRTGIPTAAHVTCLNTTKEDLKEIADALWDKNIRHIVALRGDGDPLGDRQNYFKYTNEFVAALKSWHDFEISVGSYPEHPSYDIEPLRLKADAGANRAITQFFFNNDAFYKFRDAVTKAGIKIPVVPGIVPIGNFASIVRFADKCGATVPDWLRNEFAKVKGDKEASESLAMEIVYLQTADLAANGVDHIHFYTLNKSAMPMKACEALGLIKAPALV